MTEKLIRLFVEDRLAAGTSIEARADRANYLLAVMRLAEGDRLLLFNGVDGEWVARIAARAKRSCVIELLERRRAQDDGPDILYLFAPLKRARLDYMVQKATELGVARLCPVLTARTQAERVNLDRMRANAVEAAEQCGILRIPGIAEPRRLAEAITALEPGRLLVFCDEEAPLESPLRALSGQAPGPLAVLVGPEGGFAPEERQLVRSRKPAVAISLGPRIMRADTAAVAALALVNAALGDWR